MKRTAIMIVLATVACAERDVIFHADDGQDDDADNVVRGGNFPEPAFTVCGMLPAGVDPMDDLASAHALTGARPNNSEGTKVDSSIVRLRLSSYGLEADESPLSESCGPIGWLFSFDVPPEHLVPGVHALVDIVPGYPEVFVNFGGPGCGAGEDGGANGPVHVSGELELFAVTPTCIMGELRGIELFGFLPEPNGGFVAQRANVDCIEVLGGDCQ